MSRTKDETVQISRLIGDSINNYLPTMKARSEKTLEGYENAISSYLMFLETEKIVQELKIVPDSFFRQNIENWLILVRDLSGNLQQPLGSHQGLPKVCCSGNSQTCRPLLSTGLVSSFCSLARDFAAGFLHTTTRMVALAVG